jgi:vancomycin permeability regulator SanA
MIMRKMKRLWLMAALLPAVCLLAVIMIAVSGLNDKVGKADIALVLGNKVETNGTPSRRLRARLDKTLELYFAGYFTTIIVSGGIGKEGYDEAKVMRDYLVANGISLENIIMDNRGINTLASAKNTLEILSKRKLNSVFIVSQYFHLPRARLALRNYGVSVIYSAHANFFEVRDIYSLLREVVGYVDYAFRH